MRIKKSISILGMLFFLPCLLFAQNAPTIIVVTKAHFDRSSNKTYEDWLAVEKEFFNKVTAKNELILGANVLVHYYTDDNSEVLFVTAYHSWEDIEKADERNNELAKAAWPDSVQRQAFFDKQNAFYTSRHSDEIRTILPNSKMLPVDTASQVYAVRTMHRAFPKDGKPGEFRKLQDEYDQNVTLKNSLVKGYYPSRHAYGADSREYIEAFVYASLADMEKANKAQDELEKAHWPDEAARKAFFDKLGSYFENWHGDALYRNTPALRKVAAPAK